MLKSMVVILAMFGSVSANAVTVNMSDAVQDQKAVGAATNPLYAVQDQKAVGAATNPLYAVQDQKAVSVDSQVETAQLLDLNEGF